MRQGIALRTEEEKANAIQRSRLRARIATKRRHFHRYLRTKQEATSCGVVYFVTDGSGFVKIGRTSGDIAKRISAMQTSNPRKLKLIGTIKTDDAMEIESAIHVTLAHRRHEIGEWFAIDTDDVVECLAFYGGSLAT